MPKLMRYSLRVGVLMDSRRSSGQTKSKVHQNHLTLKRLTSERHENLAYQIANKNYEMITLAAVVTDSVYYNLAKVYFY
jgi:hypothetical protein